MAHHRRIPDRRLLITGVVAGGVLCGVWLMPSAQAGDDTRPERHSEVTTVGDDEDHAPRVGHRE